jgi:hypothetical protein
MKNWYWNIQDRCQNNFNVQGYDGPAQQLALRIVTSPQADQRERVVACEALTSAQASWPSVYSCRRAVELEMHPARVGNAQAGMRLRATGREPPENASQSIPTHALRA